MRVSSACLVVLSMCTLVSACTHSTELRCPRLSSRVGESAGAGSPWRPAVLSYTDTIPLSRSLEGIFWGVGAEDSATFQQYGGNVVWAYQSFRALDVQMGVAGLRNLASDTTSDPQHKITRALFGGYDQDASCRQSARSYQAY